MERNWKEIEMSEMSSGLSVAVVITACHELRENLERTVESAVEALEGCDGSVRVVLDGFHLFDELPFLNEIQRDFWVWENLEVPEVETNVPEVSFVIPWRESRGVGPCRDWAAVNVDADVLLFCDGHMEFPEGLGARVAGHLAKHPMDLTCCKMQNMDWEWVDKPGNPHGGCSLFSYVEENGNRRGVAAKWMKGGGMKPARKVACAMGACYGIRRERYMEIGRPWAILRGWGCAEQTISVANRLCGGRVWLLDEVCRHMYASPHHRVARDDDGIEFLVNHYAFVSALVPEELQGKMRAWMLEGQDSEGFAQIIEGRLASRGADVDRLRRAVEAGKDYGGIKTAWNRLNIRRWKQNGSRSTFASVKKRSLGAFVPRKKKRKLPPTPEGDVSQVVVVKHTKCKMCDARDSFVAIEGYRNLGSFDQRQMKCKVCGHKAVFRRV